MYRKQKLILMFFASNGFLTLNNMQINHGKKDEFCCEEDFTEIEKCLLDSKTRESEKELHKKNDNVFVSKYACDVCKINLDTEIVRFHFIVNHTDQLICPICRIFMNKKSRNDHIIECHCMCTFCFKGYKNSKDAKNCVEYHKIAKYLIFV